MNGLLNMSNKKERQKQEKTFVPIGMYKTTASWLTYITFNLRGYYHTQS